MLLLHVSIVGLNGLISDFELWYALIFNFSLNPVYILDMKLQNAVF